MSDSIEWVEQEQDRGFGVAVDRPGESVSYSEAWDYVKFYLTEEYNITEYWECRDLDERDDFYSGVINGAVWIATHDDVNECWDFDFMTYENYEEYLRSTHV